VKKKLLLVYPKNYVLTYSDAGETVDRFTRKPGGPLNVSLATVAAMTHPEFEVSIVNENVEPIDFDDNWDLVGVTGHPTQLQRAKEIAAEFKKRGVLVVCGGPSVSLSPERWKPFADVLIIGEAERIWPQFVDDYLGGSYKEEYRETERFDLSISPLPDYSGYSKKSLKKFMGGIVQASRGCPYDCDFCDVITYNGRTMRYKPVGKILQEVEQLYMLKQTRVIFLADDNFPADRKKAKAILRAFGDFNGKHRRKLTFYTQLSIDAAEDEEFLELSAEAGLIRCFVGIETPNVDSLKECNKHQNVRTDMLKGIKTFHEHGIFLFGGCMVGFDSDDLTIFQRQYDFFMKTGIFNVHVFPVQASDGSRLKKRMMKEGRYLDWEETFRTDPGNKNKNVINTFTIVPKQMTLEQLKQGVRWLMWNLYKPDKFARRFISFFEDYEASPHKKEISIPRSHIDIDGLKIARRLLTHLLFRESAAGRRAFRRMFECARKSCHPHRFVILAESFLRLKNVHDILSRENPGIDEVQYPSQQGGMTCTEKIK
jgi:radical SAM superfamily enzyme YgiQ (UPF0313 family)